MHKSLILTVLFILLINFSSKGQVNLVFPKSNYVFDNTTVDFSWNSYRQASTYHLQIATNSDFSNLIIDENNLSSLTYTAFSLPTNAIFYWRVKSNNSNWSNLLTFTIVDYRTWSELEFYLDPDSVILDINGRVEQWTDLSGNNGHFTQTNSIRRPIQNTDIQTNNQTTISFNPFLKHFLEGISLTHLNQGEIFSLVKKNTFPTPTSYSGALWRFSPINSNIDVYPFTNNYVYSGFGRTNRYDQIFLTDSLEMRTAHILNISSTSDFVFRLNKVIRFSSSTGNVGFPNKALLGMGQVNLEYYFDGSFGQILFFKSVLNDSLRSLIHSQMQHKYAPPVNLGPNIAHYGFCDTTLYAGKRFTSYLWSNGSTADSLFVSTWNLLGRSSRYFWFYFSRYG